ncbi:hypothetical protein JCM10213_008338 [Rhodosporidiobolus nylandii]
MRPSLCGLTPLFLFAFTSFAAPLLLSDLSNPKQLLSVAPVGAKSPKEDPVAAALASKLAAINRQIGRLPVLPISLPPVVATATPTTPATLKVVENQKKVVGLKGARLTRRTLNPKTLRPTPSSTPDAPLLSAYHRHPAQSLPLCDK